MDDDRADASGGSGGSGGDGDGRAGAIGIPPTAGSSEGPSWGLIVPLLALLLLLGVTAGALAGRARMA